MDALYATAQASGSDLLAPDIITPAQHRDLIRPEATDQPEIRLMLAVIEDAVSTFAKHLREPSTATRKLFDDTHLWITSEETVWPYSFENICLTLKMEPALVRRKLLSWAKNPTGSPLDRARFALSRVNGKRHSIRLREKMS